MASASLAEGAHVPVVATAVRAELARTGGLPAGVPLPETGVPATLLTDRGGAAGTAAVIGPAAAPAGPVDLRDLPREVTRVLFRVPAGERPPGAVLRLVRAEDAAELARLALAPEAAGGGELYRTAGDRWAFRALPAGAGDAPSAAPGGGAAGTGDA
ncbi:hypothetical protein, partial [Streptomyces fuscigenes]|uniref:hypothetical protein n=1 Tax=Streptomyces fuscigenes TaxID=1528880 RepID=UPI00355873FE|nr:hypothetical protein [Streptomyces fuscigenes]